MKVSLSPTLSTLTKTSSKLLQSSLPFAMRQTSLDKVLTMPAEENWLEFSDTGLKRLARETLTVENFGLRRFIGWKNCAVKTQTTRPVTTIKVVGLQMPTRPILANSTMVEDPSSSLGITTTVYSPMCSPPAPTIANSIFSSIQISCNRMETWRWLQVSGST